MKRGYFFILLTICIFSLPLQAQSRKSVSGAEATGTFTGRGGNEFKIRALGNNKLKIAFYGTYEYKVGRDLMANTGEASGTADIAGDTAVFKPEGAENCSITIKFLANKTIKVTQEGDDADCGFGRRVYSEGTYRKISARKPKFE